jgi:hypothetical protein
MEEKEKSVREITAELNLPKFKNAARYLTDLDTLLSLYTTMAWSRVGSGMHPDSIVSANPDPDTAGRKRSPERKKDKNYVLLSWMFSFGA